jgi:multimeric flavodoxin WrbA
MKVVAIIGSPRKNGNTERLAAYALKAISTSGFRYWE